MAFPQFARDQYVRVLETNETATMGKYAISSSSELDQILVWINVEGTPGGTETLQVLIYGSPNTTVPLYSSTVLAVADIDFTFDPNNGDWIGVVPFVFNRESMSGGQSYYLSLKAQNYTRNSDTYYIGYIFDNPEPIYSRFTPNEKAAKAILVGYE